MPPLRRLPPRHICNAHGAFRSWSGRCPDCVAENRQQARADGETLAERLRRERLTRRGEEVTPPTPGKSQGDEIPY